MSVPLNVPARISIVDAQGRMTPEFARAMQEIIRRLGGTASGDTASGFADILAPFVVTESVPEMLTQPAQADSPLAFETTYQG